MYGPKRENLGHPPQKNFQKLATFTIQNKVYLRTGTNRLSSCFLPTLEFLNSFSSSFLAQNYSKQQMYW